MAEHGKRYQDAAKLIATASTRSRKEEDGTVERRTVVIIL